MGHQFHGDYLFHPLANQSGIIYFSLVVGGCQPLNNKKYVIVQNYIDLIVGSIGKITKM